MQHPLINSHEVIDGQFVNAKVRRVIQAIREYEPEIIVQWVPPAAREEGYAAYRVIHRPPNRDPYIMFTVRRDEDFDERVLQRIIVNDQRNGRVTLSEFEAWEAAQKAIKHQEWLDSLEEAHDIAKHVLKSRLNKYRVDKNTVIEDRGGIF